MITTINSFDFVRAFEEAGRSTQFTHAAKLALFEYLEELEEDSGVPWELDVVSICCDFSEYPTALEAVKDYGIAMVELEELGRGDWEEAALEWLEERTSVISFDGGVIFVSF